MVRGIKALYGQEVPLETVQLQKTKKEFAGHLTLVVFPSSRFPIRNPKTRHRTGRFPTDEIPAVVAGFNVVGWIPEPHGWPPEAWTALLADIHKDESFRTGEGH